MACIAYGTALAMLDGRIRSSLVDVLKWSVGPLFERTLPGFGEQMRAHRLLDPVLLLGRRRHGVFEGGDPPLQVDVLLTRDLAQDLVHLGADLLRRGGGQPAPERDGPAAPALAEHAQAGDARSNPRHPP